jgi:hypothetical protein
MLGSSSTKEVPVTEEALEEMGPIDYVVLEWPGRQPKGDVVPLLIDLVERGVIRILDIALMVKGEDGSVAALDLGEVNGGSRGFQEFDGASTGLITQEDLEEAAAVLAPGTSAAVLVWENRWAAPVAVAVRRSGGQLVASGRIHVQALIAALEETELASPSTS